MTWVSHSQGSSTILTLKIGGHRLSVLIIGSNNYSHPYSKKNKIYNHHVNKLKD